MVHAGGSGHGVMQRPLSGQAIAEEMTYGRRAHRRYRHAADRPVKIANPAPAEIWSDALVRSRRLDAVYRNDGSDSILSWRRFVNAEAVRFTLH
jgi:hypothetical protein